MNQTVSPASRGLPLKAAVFGLLVALGIGFAAGWLVRDAKDAGGGRPAAGPENAAMAAQIDALTAKTAADPRDADAWKHLGHLYFDSGQPGPAVAAYAKYLELTPGDPDVLTDMGVMYRELGQTDKALECFDAAIKLNPRHEIAHFNKGIVLLTDKGDTDGALAVFAELLRINPNAKAPDGSPVAALVDTIRPQAGPKPGMLIGK
jgi:tetratricopeptide (TPR) repeat protein